MLSSAPVRPMRGRLGCTRNSDPSGLFCKVTFHAEWAAVPRQESFPHLYFRACRKSIPMAPSIEHLRHWPFHSICSRLCAFRKYGFNLDCIASSRPSGWSQESLPVWKRRFRQIHPPLALAQGSRSWLRGCMDSRPTEATAVNGFFPRTCREV